MSMAEFVCRLVPLCLSQTWVRRLCDFFFWIGNVNVGVVWRPGTGQYLCSVGIRGHLESDLLVIPCPGLVQQARGLRPGERGGTDHDHTKKLKQRLRLEKS